jgi:hypothetical protein
MSTGGAHARGDAALLRIYFGESDRVSGRPASEALLAAAHDGGLAGATLFRGSLGFGANSVIHQPQPFRLSGDLPMVLEVVDDRGRVDAFVASLEGLLTGGGLVTVERVTVLRGGGHDEGRPT